MSEQLYRRVVRTDGHDGHWYDYEPVEERTCEGCANKDSIHVFEPLCEQCARNYPDLYSKVVSDE